MTTGNENVELNQEVPRENTSVLMKVIIGILCAIAMNEKSNCHL